MSTADFAGVLMAIGLVASLIGFLISVILTLCTLIGIFTVGWTAILLTTLIPMAFLGVAGTVCMTQIKPWG